MNAFLLEPSFFLWECWRATPCKGKETVLLFGSRFIIVWGYQSNQRMRMSRGHHGISADSCIWSYWRRNACAFDKSCWKRYIYLFTTRCFDHNPSFFLPKKPVPAPLLKKKGLHQDDEPCSILYQVAAWGVLYERPTGQKGLPAFRRSRSPGAWPQAALAFLAKVHGARRTGREAALRLGRLMGWAEGYGLMGRFWVLKTSSSMEEMMIPLFLMILMDALYIYTFSLSI